jgi:hypothetical protein
MAMTETSRISMVATKLRELARWYREFAERAGNPWIWEARLQLAEDLESQAAKVKVRADSARPQTRLRD